MLRTIAFQRSVLRGECGAYGTYHNTNFVETDNAPHLLEIIHGEFVGNLLGAKLLHNTYIPL